MKKITSKFKMLYFKIRYRKIYKKVGKENFTY